MNLSLKFKILGPVLAATILMLVTSLVGFSKTYNRVIAMTDASKASVEKNRKIADIERQFGVMIQDWKNTLLRGSNQEAFKKHSAGMDEAIEKQKSIAKQLLPTLEGAEKKSLSQFIENLDVLESKYKGARAEFLKSDHFTPASADAAVKGVDRKALDPMAALVKKSSDDFQAFQETSTAELKTNIILSSIFLSILVAMALIAIAYIITRTTNYINTLIVKLLAIASQVRASSLNLEETSSQLSQATTEQASSLEETASSLEEIGTMVAKASEGASSTETSSNDSQRKAVEGRKAVEQMMSSMEEISQSNEAIMKQVNQSNQEMSEIVKVIQEIGEKTKVINDIVFQTKLLSFNASVEAARAGEHGKGFAVVAEEVGNLAKMSGSAAKEITDMLGNSIAKVEQIVANTKTRVESLVGQGKDKVDSGVSVARQCAAVLDEIVQNVSKVNGLAREISSATREQSQGIGEINKAMAQLDTVTQQNSATSEEAARAAEELSSQAAALKEAVDDLVLTVEGGSSNASAGTPPQTGVRSAKLAEKVSPRAEAA